MVVRSVVGRANERPVKELSVEMAKMSVEEHPDWLVVVLEVALDIVKGHEVVGSSTEVAVWLGCWNIVVDNGTGREVQVVALNGCEALISS